MTFKSAEKCQCLSLVDENSVGCGWMCACCSSSGEGENVKGMENLNKLIEELENETLAETKKRNYYDKENFSQRFPELSSKDVFSSNKRLKPE